MKLPAHSFPLIPKRRLVSPHVGSWGQEKEHRQIDRNQYQGRIHRIINPWVMQQLKRDERFHVTAFEK
jgi:hypothetical protein